MFHLAKLSTLRGFTKGVSVDVLYLQINDVLEYSPPYVQSGSDGINRMLLLSLVIFF